MAENMTGETDLNTLLRNMSPVLDEGEYIFLTVDGEYGDFDRLDPLGAYREKEGLTLIVLREVVAADSLLEVPETEIFRAITLEVHSSLNAVGLTAAVASKLAAGGISANVVAAYYHDHIFVPAEKAERAMKLLRELSGDGKLDRNPLFHIADHRADLHHDLVVGKVGQFIARSYLACEPQPLHPEYL